MATFELRPRLRAATIHLLISFVVAGLVALFLLLVWYPSPWREAAGGVKLILIILVVDVTLGPLLTFFVFDRKKKSLPYDLAFVGLLQLSALVYGCYIAADARPAFVVAVGDRIYVTGANAILPESYAAAKDPVFAAAPWTGPVLIGAIVSGSADERFKALSTAMAGADLNEYPAYFVAWSDALPKLLEKSQAAAALLARSGSEQAKLERWLQQYADLRVVPVKGRFGWYAGLLEPGSGIVVDVLNFDPWPE